MYVGGAITATSLTLLSGGEFDSGKLIISNNTVSTSTNTGALQVTGGVGIGGNLNVGGLVKINSTLTVGGDILPTADGVYNLGSDTLRWNTLYVSAFTLNVGGLAISNNNGYMTAAAFASTATIASTGTNSGAIIVAGGVGVGGDIYGGGKLVVPYITATNSITVGTTSTTGQLNSSQAYVNPTTGYTSSFYLNPYGIFDEAGSNNQVFQIYTNATGTNAGTLQGGGGGGIWTAGGGMQIYSTDVLTFRMGASAHQGSYPTGGTNGNGRNIVFSNTGSVYIGSNDVSSSVSTGALVVNGGVGVAGTLNVGAAVNAATLNVTGLSTLANTTVTTFTATSATILGNETVYGVLNVQNSTIATSTNTGALIVTGGVGIGGDLVVGGNITAATLTVSYTTVTQTLVTSPDIFTITNTTQSLGTGTGALTVTGGAGIGGNLNVGGTIVGGGVRSTSTSTAPASATVGDIWYDTLTDDIYRYTSDGSNSYWLDITGPAIANAGGGASFSGGTVSNAVNITSTTASTGTNTGALTVTGGAGIGGNLNVGGTLLVSNIYETVNVIAGAVNSTPTAYFTPGAVTYYTSNAGANWTQNLTYRSGVTLNSVLAVGQSASIAILTTQGSPAYYMNGTMTIDGSSSNVTVYWQGGTAPTKGNVSGIDSYTYTVIKTAATPAYTVLASQTQF